MALITYLPSKRYNVGCRENARLLMLEDWHIVRKEKMLRNSATKKRMCYTCVNCQIALQTVCVGFSVVSCRQQVNHLPPVRHDIDCRVLRGHFWLLRWAPCSQRAAWMKQWDTKERDSARNREGTILAAVTHCRSARSSETDNEGFFKAIMCKTKTDLQNGFCKISFSRPARLLKL